MRFDALSNAALCPGVRRGSDYAHLSLSGAEKEDWYRVPPCTNQVPMQDVCLARGHPVARAIVRRK